MNIAVIKETLPGEHRVALVPASVPAIVKLNSRITIEAGAGEAAGFRDEDYRQAGAQVVADRHQILQQADVLLQVRIHDGAAQSPTPSPQSPSDDLELER